MEIESSCYWYGCTEKPVDGITHCEQHRQRVNETTGQYKRRLKAAGLCTMGCGAPIDAEYSAICCRACREKITDRIQRLRDDRLFRGLCQTCGKLPPQPDRKRCTSCLEAGKQYDRHRRSGVRYVQTAA